MEAMTQEFMLHRRPHDEIWSAREGSDDDSDSIQRQPWTLKGSTSENKSLMDPNKLKQTKKDPLQKPQKSEGPQPTNPTTNHGNQMTHLSNKHLMGRN